MSESKTCKDCCDEFPIWWFPLDKGKPGPICSACKKERHREACAAYRSRKKAAKPDPIRDALHGWRTGEESAALVVPLGVVCELPRWRVAA